jgi:hypothetical protein
LLLLALLLLLLPGSALGATPKFSDIGNNWAQGTITSFASKGLIKGYPDGTFRPNNPITRAEFTVLLENCLGITPSSTAPAATFSDTASNWASAQINEAITKGILVTSEYPNGLKPDGPILRSEAAAMMVRALGLSPDNTATTFADQSQITKSMYAGYIKAASDAGLMNGYPDGTFGPFQQVTRAQACAMLTSLMDKQNSTATQTTPATPTTPATTSTSNSLTSLVVQGNTYNLGSTPIGLYQNYSDTPVSSISLIGSTISINNTYTFALNSTSNNPDLVVNNARYMNCQLSVSGNSLVATPGSLVLDSLTYNSYTYQADYVNLYIGSQNDNYYLSDATLVNQNTVQIGGTSYNLGSTQISVSLAGNFYAIQGINISSAGISLDMTAIAPVVQSNLSLSDITAIFDSSQSLDLSTISSLTFIVGNTQYSLSSVVIDSSGNFTVNGKTYPPGEVTMIVTNTSNQATFYQLTSVSSLSSKFIFNCTASSVTGWAIVNGSYVDASTVNIICGGGIYALNNVLVVSDNVIRVNGQQYDASSATCQYNGTYYTIEDINYNSTLGLPTLETGTATTTPVETVSSQPSSYVFYLASNNSVLQNGDSGAAIDAGGTFVSFSGISFPDSSHFAYNGTNYSLIGAEVQINSTEYTISDTAWRTSSQIMEVYLQAA